MWTAQTLGSVSPREHEWDGMNFAAYGLGWQVTDMHGYKVLSHGGGLPGIRDFIMLIPDLHLATVVLTNQENREAMDAVTAQIVKSYMPVPHQDWVEKYAQERTKTLARIKATDDAQQKALVQRASLPLSDYAGTYRDPWFGDVTITQDAGGLTFRAARAPLLTGRMQPYTGDVFIVHWNDRSIDADAYVEFPAGFDGLPHGMNLKPVSAGTSLIFDYHDLNFQKLNPAH